MTRYFVALKVISQLNDHGMPSYAIFRKNQQQTILRELANWAAAPAQTSQQILAAIKQLQELGDQFMRFEDGSKSLYVAAQRFLSGDETAAFLFLISRGQGKVELQGSRLWSVLMPWEKDRAMRMLNVLTSAALGRLERMHEILREQSERSAETWLAKKWEPATQGEKLVGVNDVLPLYHRSPADYFGGRYNAWHDRSSMQRAEWMATTNPDLAVVGSWGIEAAHELARFETQRRATIIILAAEAFRLDHGKLPQSLAELTGRYLDAVPLDPYSAKEFAYLPEGLPQPADAMEADAFRDRKVAFGRPGIWSIGPDLTFSYWQQADEKDEATGKVTAGSQVLFYSYRLPGREGQRLPISEAWSRGIWFPIPAPKH